MGLGFSYTINDKQPHSNRSIDTVLVNAKTNETKEQAIKNLDAINNDEQKVLLKVNRKKGDQKKKSKTKDW